MLKSIVVTALRNFLRNRTFSVINLVGLSVSMSLALLIISVIQEQFTFDDFHVDADRIYRINTRALRTDGGEEPYASVPYPLGKVLEEEYSFAESVVRINRNLNGDATAGTTTVPVSGLLADPTMLKVFNFPLSSGDAASVLSQPNNIVLTFETSVRLFGNQDPMGKAVSIPGYGEFIVTGVLRPFEGRTHFEFDVLGSTALLPRLEKDRAIESTVESWTNYYGSYVYFKLREGRSIEEVEKGLSAVPEKYYADVQMETRDNGYQFFVLPLEDLTPGPMLSNQMGSGMPMMLVIFLGVLAGIIMVMACFNYTNLMIAKSVARVREIGIRKVIGAKHSQVFVQFIGESVVFALLALVTSYGLLQLLKPAFQELHIAQEFSVQLDESAALLGYFVVFALATGLVAGVLPAGYLAALRPVSVLKDSGNTRILSRQSLRKSLIVAQFTLSTAFIILIVVIFNQVNFMLSKDYGFNDRDIFNVALQGVPYEKLSVAMQSIPGVIQIGGVSHRLGTWQDRASDYKTRVGGEPFVMRDFMVDDNYVRNLELSFLAGKNFTHTVHGGGVRQVILNERALQRFGFADPVASIGQTIVVDDTVTLSVIGVVRDFHFRPMNYEIGPLALRYDSREFGFLSAKIVPGKDREVAAALEPVWKILDPVHPLEWKMMSDEIDEAYTDSGFVDVVKIVGYIAFLAVTLACLGMLGMAMYATQTRMKEIGIRKVMGASAFEVVFLLSKAFLILIAIAATIGTPFGYFMGSLFLDSYAYKAPISAGVLASGFAIMGILGTLVIGTQTWKAAAENPVDSLRYE